MISYYCCVKQQWPKPEVKKSQQEPPRSPPDFYLIYYIFPKDIQLISWPRPSTSSVNNLHGFHLQRDHLLCYHSLSVCLHCLFVSWIVGYSCPPVVWSVGINVGYCCFVLCSVWSVLTSILS